MILYLARHAHCEKNHIGVPGGPGTALTLQGLTEARLLRAHIGAAKIKPTRIVACPPIQTQQTAAIVAASLDINYEVSAALQPIDLGVLAGIPMEVAREKFPASSASMDLWRAGRIELCEVRIDEMEDPARFYQRGISFVLNFIKVGEPVLVVATTSIMILIENIHQRKTPEPGGGYRSHNYGNAQLLQLSFSDTDIEWLHSQVDIYGFGYS